MYTGNRVHELFTILSHRFTCIPVGKTQGKYAGPVPDASSAGARAEAVHNPGNCIENAGSENRQTRYAAKIPTIFNPGYGRFFGPPRRWMNFRHATLRYLYLPPHTNAIVSVKLKSRGRQNSQSKM